MHSMATITATPAKANAFASSSIRRCKAPYLLYFATIFCASA
jgi:hypothetical protein